MTTALATTNPGFMQPAQWAMMNQQAEVLVKSGFLPKDVNTPQKAIAIMMVGQELGIMPWQALSTINVIQGKPTVSPQLMLGLIQRSGQLENINVDGNASQCVVTMKRKGQDAHTETFTMEDATKLGLSGKDNYRKQPGTMLKWRAIAACARTVFPDVVLGLYTPEEMGAEVSVTDTGDQVVIDAPPAPQLQVVKPDVEEAVIVENAPDNGKPEPLFQYLMKTVDHLRYAANEARAAAINKLVTADILHERIDRKTAVQAMNVYADLRDGNEPEGEALEAVRKFVNKATE